MSEELSKLSVARVAKAIAKRNRNWGTKPTIPEVEAVVREYYKDHPTGGCLHIVLEDGNVTHSDITYCVYAALRDDDLDGAYLAVVLGMMSTTQRRKLYRMDKNAPL